MKLSDFVINDAIIAELESSDRDDVITELVDSLVASGAAPADLRDELVKKLIDRERNGSTGFGKGVAVPHIMHDKIDKMIATIGVSQKGVDFNALDSAPVYSVFLLLSPKGNPDEHLQAMENIFGNLQKDTFRKFLRQASSKEDVADLLHEADTQQLQG